MERRICGSSNTSTAIEIGNKRGETATHMECAANRKTDQVSNHSNVLADDAHTLRTIIIVLPP